MLKNIAKITIILLAIIIFLANSNCYCQGNKVPHFPTDSVQEIALKLYNENKYDSILSIAKLKLKAREGENLWLSALLCSFKMKNEKDSIIRYINYYSNYFITDMINLGSIPVRFLCNYQICKELFLDKEIKDIYLYKTINNYKRKTGISSLAVDTIVYYVYEDQQLRSLFKANIDTCSTQASIKKVNNLFFSSDTVLQSAFLNFIIRNGGYISTHLVGSIAIAQKLIFWHIADTNIRRNRLLPIIRLAVATGLYSKKGYVSQIARTEELEGTISREDQSYNRRLKVLCKQEGCELIDQYYIDL